MQAKFPNKQIITNIIKTVPLIGRGNPWVYETLKLPHFLDNRLTDGGEVISLTLRPHLYSPGKFLVLTFVRG
jgi:hypothetical protein